MIVIGRINSKKYYDQLSALKSKLGLDTKVTFKGEMPREDLQEYYSLCDFLVLPSKKEGFGIVLIEALAMGKPVVSTRSGGPEDIVNGLNGLLAEPGDIPSLAGSIEQMIVKYKEYDPGVISKDIYSRYSSDKIRNKLMMVYKELLGEK